MKKYVLFLIVVIFFANVTSGSVRIKPKDPVVKQYSAEETSAANLWLKSKPLNNLRNENLIFPGQPLWFACPSTDEPTPMVTQSGDYVLKMAKRVLRERNLMITSQPAFEQTPASSNLPEAEIVYLEKDNLALWVILVLLCLIVCVLVYVWLATKKMAAEERNRHDNLITSLNKEVDTLYAQLDEAKKPIKTPAEGVSEDWLMRNNPIGDSITNSSPINISQSFNQVYGKKPDLIAKSIITGTGLMGYSFNREAQTNLKKVTAFLGWNWNKKEKKWESVGVVVGPCANWFQVRPDQIQEIDETSLEVQLSGNDHPVIFINDNVVPKNQGYPVLAGKLIVKYLETSISELDRAGVQIVIPENLK